VSDPHIASAPVCVTNPGVVDDALHLPLPIRANSVFYILYATGGALLPRSLTVTHSVSSYMYIETYFFVKVPFHGFILYTALPS